MTKGTPEDAANAIMRVADISWIGLCKVAVLVIVLVVAYHVIVHRNTATASDLDSIRERIIVLETKIDDRR